MLIILLLCLLLGACRPSPVLHDIEYTQDATQVDPDVEMEEPDLDAEEQTEDFNQEQNIQSETPRESTRSSGIFGAKGNAEQSVKAEYSAGANNNIDSQEAPGKQTENADAQEAGGGTDIAENTGGGKTYKQIVDGRGETVDVPENAEHVTAVGAAAQMVEMLGGSGRLTGSNNDLLAGIASAVFADAGTVANWWDGDGSLPISDANFAQLVASAPDVCFEISGQNTFSDAQVGQLAQAGIAYVVLPPLADADKLKQSVSIVAQVLGGDAENIASGYSKWVDDVISEVSGDTADAGSSTTGLYIFGWDAGVSYHLNNTKGVIPTDGSGLAVAFSPTRGQLISTFMDAAGVKNESTRIGSRYRDSELVYVTPMFRQFVPQISENVATYYSGEGIIPGSVDLFVSRNVANTYYQLGSGVFPAVIASSQQVKEQLDNNWYWKYHPKDSNGYIDVDGQSFYCGVVGEYDIFVNPYGMSSWEASLESPLEAYWTACKYKGTYTIDQVKEKTNQFYKDFFGVTLTPEQLTVVFGE